MDVYSPQNIIMVQDLDYDKHCNFIFSLYVEAHEYCKITNNMEERTVSDIFLETTANFQGSYKMFLKYKECGHNQAENMRNPNVNLGHPTR